MCRAPQFGSSSLSSQLELEKLIDWIFDVNFACLTLIFPYFSLDLEVVLLTRYQIPDGVDAGEEGLMSTRFLAQARQVQVWDSATNWTCILKLLYFYTQTNLYTFKLSVSNFSFFPGIPRFFWYFWHIRCRWHLGGEKLWTEIKIESWVCDPVRGGFLCTFAGLSGFPCQIKIHENPKWLHP